MSKGNYSFKINDRYDFISHSFSRRKNRYKSVLITLSEGLSLPLEFPAKVTVEEDRTCITRMEVISERQKVVFTYPVWKSCDYSCEEVGRWVLEGKDILEVFRIYADNIYFCDDEVERTNPNDCREVGSEFKLCNLQISLYHPVSYMAKHVKNSKALICELHEFFNTQKTFKPLDIINIVSNVLDVPVSEIRSLNIPKLLCISEGKLIAATIQHLDSITFVSNKYTECTTSRFRADWEAQGKHNFHFAVDNMTLQEADKEASSLITEVQNEMNFYNKNMGKANE